MKRRYKSTGPITKMSGQLYVDIYNQAGVLQSHTPTGVSSPVSYEQSAIEYDTGRKPKSSYCYHRSLKYNHGDPSLSTVRRDFSPAGSGYTITQGHHSFTLGNVSTMLAKAIDAAGFNGLDARALMSEAFHRLKPDLTTMSIPNFLFELKDIRKLYGLWNSKLTTARNVAGLHLNWSFGWKPLLGDLRTLIGLALNVEAELRAWNSRSGELLQKSTRLADEVVNVSGDLVVHGSAGNGGHLMYNFRCTRTVDAFITFRIKGIPNLDSQWVKVRALLDKLGFELNPRIVWDAIPFSFVVDWFLNVGRTMASLKIDTMQLPFELADYALHIKTKVEGEYYYRRDGSIYVPSTDLIGPPLRLSFAEFSRRVDFNNITSMVRVGAPELLSSKQAGLGVSLAVAMSSGRRAPRRSIGRKAPKIPHQWFPNA